MKKTMFTLIAMIALIIGESPHAQAKECITVGGTALAQAISPTSFIASLDGTFNAARAEVTGQEETKTGLVLGMEHYFMSSENGFIKTNDKAVLTTVSGKDNVYFIEIDYNIVEAGGTLEGYSGKFHSFGGFKMDQGKIALRYRGEMCK